MSGPNNEIAVEANGMSLSEWMHDESEHPYKLTPTRNNRKTVQFPAIIKCNTYILRHFGASIVEDIEQRMYDGDLAMFLELIDALKEALPATPGDFTALLDSYRELGMKGFDFRDGQFSLTFPFYETEPTKWTTFAGLQGRILQTALVATRVFPELIQPEEEAEKYTAHMWLQRMGYKGPEMKEQRNILLKHLHGYCAFSNGSKMQNHKDKYSAIRRERREAERAAASGETDVEVTMPTTEAEPSVVAPGKEVADND